MRGRCHDHQLLIMIFMDQWCRHHNGRHHRLLMIRTINHGINQLDNSFFHYFSDDSVVFMSCCYCCRECCLSLAFSTKRLHCILYLFGPWILFGLFLKDFFIFSNFFSTSELLGWSLLWYTNYEVIIYYNLHN